MDERIKQDIIMFLAVLVSCLLFVGVVETFTGVLAETREKNLSNQQSISSINDLLKKGQNNRIDGELISETDNLT